MREKRDIYQEVTDRIVASLEKGTVPWHKPWTSLGPPRNVKTAKPYRGINVFLLGLSALEGGYTDPRWGTSKAITDAGGQVRKGEKGTRIVFWKKLDPRKPETDPATGEEKKQRAYMLLRDFTVFNVEQADGIEPLVAETLGDDERIALCDGIVDGYLTERGPAFAYGGDRAYYSPFTDSVQIPPFGLFDGAAEHYTTLYHELAHSTGHESRLDELEPTTFGSDPYAKEELVAEMSAAMLCGLSGIDSTSDNSAAYIANWLRKLNDDKKLVVSAAAQAQKAADLIVGTTFEDESAENGSAPVLAGVAA